MSQLLLRRLYVALDHLTISELMGTLVDRSLPSCAKIVKVCYSDSGDVHVRNFLILIPSSQDIPAARQRKVQRWHSVRKLPPKLLRLKWQTVFTFRFGACLSHI